RAPRIGGERSLGSGIRPSEGNGAADAGGRAIGPGEEFKYLGRVGGDCVGSIAQPDTQEFGTLRLKIVECQGKLLDIAARRRWLGSAIDGLAENQKRRVGRRDVSLLQRIRGVVAETVAVYGSVHGYELIHVAGTAGREPRRATVIGDQ